MVYYLNSFYKKTKFVLITGLLMLFVGCSSAYVVKPDKGNKIKRVAVLPIISTVDDIDEPMRLYNDIHPKLKGSYYDVVPAKRTKNILKNKLGIALGKQLGDYSTQELGKALKVDGLIYVYLFDLNTVGGTKVYYRVGVKFVNAKSGKTIFGRGSALKNTIAGGNLVSGTIDNALGVFDFFSSDNIPSVPTSKNPAKEMPGLKDWKEYENVNDSGYLAGIATQVVSNAVDSALDTNFAFIFERSTSLKKIFDGRTTSNYKEKFPLGGYIRPTNSKK